MRLNPGDLVMVIDPTLPEKAVFKYPQKPHLLVSMPSPNSKLGICNIIPYGTDEPMPVYLKYLKKWEEQ